MRYCSDWKPEDGPEDVAELHVLRRRQRLQHRPLLGQLPQHLLAARAASSGTRQSSVVAQVRDRGAQLVDHQLHPQLGDLVLDDEQHLVVVRRVRQRLLRRQQPVQLQVAAVGQPAGRSVWMPVSSGALVLVDGHGGACVGREGYRIAPGDSAHPPARVTRMIRGTGLRGTIALHWRSDAPVLRRRASHLGKMA